MAIEAPSALTIADEMRSLARQLDSASHREKGDLVEQAMQHYGWSRAKVYSQLKTVGWSSGRKVRADRGTTTQSMEALAMVSSFERLGIRKNGKATMKTPLATSILAQNGFEISVSNSRINTLLRDRQMHLAAMKQAAPAQNMRSLHPNHVHQVDPSLCLVYYLPNGEQHIMRDEEFYKNKLEKIAKIEFKVWRYVLTDHYSASIIIKYYQAKGETQANLYDFLLYCWSKKDSTLLHGVPKLLIWDKGSANGAGAIKNALRSLDVQQIPHTAGNARAKGGVENGNNLGETLFESRLRLEPVSNVDELNAAAEHWYNAYNANAIPNYDSRLKRKHMAQPMARYGLWQMIRKEQLRILPDIEVCRQLLSGADVERKVSQDLSISFRNPVTKQRQHYDLRHIPGIHIGQMVKVSPMVYGAGNVIVSFSNYLGEEISQIVEPITGDAISGFADTAQVFGEGFKSQPDTVVEQAAKAADRLAYPGKTAEQIEAAKRSNTVPFDGRINAHSHLANVQAPAFMERPGEMMNVPNRLQIEIKPLSNIEAKVKLRNLLGRSLTAADSANLAAWYPDGIMEDQLQEVVLALEGKLETAPKLVAVK